MEKLQRYMAAFDGSTDWSTVEELFEDAFHDDAVFVLPDGELNKQQWAELSKRLRARGAVASGFEVTKSEGDSIWYEVTVTQSGEEPLHLAARGTVRDGQMIRVEPLDPSAYSAMVQRGS